MKRRPKQSSKALHVDTVIAGHTWIVERPGNHTREEHMDVSRRHNTPKTEVYCWSRRYKMIEKYRGESLRRICQKDITHYAMRGSTDNRLSCHGSTLAATIIFIGVSKVMSAVLKV